MPYLRRASDSQQASGRRFRLPGGEHALRALSWEDQRAQFLTRYLFWALGLAYFNFGSPVARSAEYLVAINLVHLAYVVLTTVYLMHARHYAFSPMRWRLAMWTDLVGVSFAVLADVNVMSPAYLVYLAIIFGNGMRYGLRPFGEAVLGTFLLGLVVLYLRLTDQLNALSVTTVFFIMFGAIIVLYTYSLMTRIEKSRRQLETESSLDPLTGLLNRRALYRKAADLFQSLERGGRTMTVLFADLDGFKAVNDALGHHVGDRVLKHVAGIIVDTIRAADTAARFGGDEFIVIMPDTTLREAAIVAQRLQAELNAWSQADDLQLSVSIGIGEAPNHGHDLDSLLERVDIAMYQCKQTLGRGSIRNVDEGMLRADRVH